MTKHYNQFTKLKTYKMADANLDIIDAAARNALPAQKQTAIALNFPLFSAIKPYSITTEQWIQRVNNAVATGGLTNCVCVNSTARFCIKMVDAFAS